MLGQARILVADDDPDMLQTVALTLERLGAEVATALSGAELIEQLAYQGPFSLVVTDISMPWMSGLHAMRSARTAGVAAPVIVMTGLRDARIPEQVLALGQNAALLRKPFELSELAAVASELLSSQDAP